MNKEMVKAENKYDTFEFIRGQQECRDGLPADPNGSESYQAGYGAEYQLTEINLATKGKDHVITL